MLKTVLQFLFGRDAQIFNRRGKVQHDLGKSKWDQWTHRFDKNPEYDFKHHKGREAKDSIKH